MSSFSPVQRAMAIAPKCSGFVSLCASTYIVQHVLRDRKRRNLTYHRLLCGMSISDMFGSFMCFLSTWPIPRGEAFLASGTVQTCAAQGFFNQSAALCTPTYNISLAIYYLLVVVGGWKEKRVEGVEKYLHALPIVAGLGTGIAGLILKLYNGAGWICWIAPGLPNHPKRHNPNYGVFRLAFLYADAWAIIVFLAVTMAVIYYHVLKQERSLDKYCSSSFASKKRKQSKKIRNQAFLYVAALYMTWIFGSTFRLMQFAGKKPPPAIIVLFVTFFPLQGFFNLVVYKFPQIHRYCEKKKKGSVSTSTSNSGGSITSLLSSIRRNKMEKKQRKRGENKVDARLTSVTLESENRISAIVKESEAHAIDDDHDVEEVNDVGQSTVTFAPDVELKEYMYEKSFENAERIEGGWEDENGDSNCGDDNEADNSDAIGELAHIVEA